MSIKRSSGTTPSPGSRDGFSYSNNSKTGWTATASGSFGTTAPVDAIDDDITVGWHSALSTTGRWWRVDTGSGGIPDIGRVKILAGVTQNDIDIKLEYSDNDSDWTQIGADFYFPVDQTTTFDFSPITARYWRITGTEAGYLSILEVWFLTVIEIGGPETWVTALFNRPSDETVHADDQEFTDTIGGTAVTPTGTATWTQSKSLLSVVADSIATLDVGCRLYSLTPTSAPVTIETAFRIMNSYDTTPTAGLIMTDGITATDDAVHIYWDTRSPAIGFRSGTITNLSTLDSQDVQSAYNIGSHIYMRLIWTAANTFKAAVSPDGVSWTPMNLSATTKTMTPTHIGVAIGTWGTTIDQVASFEYLRVTESDLSV